MLTILFMLSGCNVISPFVGEKLKASVCDRDRDGLGRSSDYCGGEDCDDADDTIGAPTGWYRDVDLDTYGAGEEEFSCSQPEGFVTVTGDCDDTDELVSPGGVESCNDVDDDCDGDIDEENITVWYLDADQDSYGNVEIYLVQCDEPVGYVVNAQDCNDLEPTINPEGTEVCDNRIDEDCNDLVDDAEGSQAWYADVDMDGYGDSQAVLYSCEESVDGYVLDATDCDDTNLDVNPSANEACRDEVDNDCDGEVDTDAVDVAWYADADEDGYGDVNITTEDCAPPEGYVGNAEDCDDASSEVNPGVEETCNNGVDDNCDESPNACELSGTMSLTDADATFTGIETLDYAGYSVASAGDVNDDGFPDILIGAYGAGDGGEVYIFFGPHGGSEDMRTADITFTGPSASETGYAVAGDCDLDGDGNMDDLAISARSDTDGGSAAGAVWAVLGPLSSGVFELNTVGEKLNGSSSDWAGSSLSCAGDVNNDGVDDLLIGAPISDDVGTAYLVFGPPEAGSLTDEIIFVGEQRSDLAGTRVAITEDVNKDGFDDMLVGAYGEDSTAEGAGAIYVIYGPGSSRSLADADAKILGEAASNLAGYSLAPAGDLDADGNNDFLVGAFEESGVESGAGATYVVMGPPLSGSLADEIKWTGASTGDNLGYTMAGGCDINADGAQDVVIAARYAGASDAGVLYGLYDPTAGGTIADADFQLEGESADDAAGESISLFDVNMDGMCDILVGVHKSDTAGTDAGKIYLIYGLGY